jgi:hypothetical protein
MTLSVLDREGGQLLDQAALPGLKACPGPVALGCDQPCCLRRCPRPQGHGATMPCALDRAQAAVLAG